MTVCLLPMDEEKETTSPHVPNDPKREDLDIIIFVLLFFCPEVILLLLTGAWWCYEIDWSPWCPSSKEDNLVLVKWERKGPRHQSVQRNRSGLPDDLLTMETVYLCKWDGKEGGTIVLKMKGSKISSSIDKIFTWINQIKFSWIVSSDRFGIFLSVWFGFLFVDFKHGQ